MNPQEDLLKWKVDVPALFAELLGANNHTWIFRQPMVIIDAIMREGAAHALKLGDEQMISIFARLGMYEGCSQTNHPDHAKLMELTNKTF